MPSIRLMPRPVPALHLMFNSVSLKRPEQQIQAVELWRQRVRWMSANDTHTSAKIDQAYRNEKGDILFDSNYNWFLLPKGEATAYKIKTAPQYGEQDGVYAQRLLHELSGDEMGVLRINRQNKDVATLSRLFGADINMNLRLLNEAEKGALLHSLTDGKVKLVGLPYDEQVLEAYKRPNGEYLIITSNKTDFDKDTLRMFKGSRIDDLKVAYVDNHEIYRDGGTSYYYTEAGTLYVPSPLPRYNDYEPLWLDGNFYQKSKASVDNWLENKLPVERLIKVDIEDLTRIMNRKGMLGLRPVCVPA